MASRRGGQTPPADPPEDPVDPQEQAGEGQEPLSSIAQRALASGEWQQPRLEGTDYARVKFVGMAWDTPTRPDLKQEVTLKVKAICVGHAEEVMADGEIRTVAKMKVVGVVPVEEPSV